MKKKDKAVAANQEADYIHDLQEQIESLKDNVTFVQDNINESQSSIMQIEEVKVSDRAAWCR